ncbi:uncharacterized protein LOC131943845 [Physella acuta]|uniref:uncharacterized protein LOC131943845 n=1 Tax=Physella acuta TaxID=109671 RepID=UPI0027DB16D2|nr:uncharacterized protein LOC131943845 [Physella acuta]
MQITMWVMIIAYVSWIGLFCIQEIKSCEPVEENTNWKLSKTFNVTLTSKTQRFIWNLNNEVVSDCYVNENCINDPQTNWFKSFITHHNNVLSVELNIFNVTRLNPWKNSEGTWLLQMSTFTPRKEEKSTVFSCFLNVYKKVNHLDCQLLELKDHIMLQCKTHRRYPTVRGTVSVSVNGKPMKSLQHQNFECTHRQPYNNPVYFDSDCRLKIYEINKGQYVFNINLYPNVTNTAKDTLFGKSISHFYTLETVPEPVIELEKLNSKFKPYYSSLNSKYFNLDEGLYSIRCLINETTSTLKLECDQPLLSLNNGVNVLNISRIRNSVLCKCEASHERVLYESNSTFVLINVLYPPTIQSFLVNGENVNTLIVNKSEVLNFACEAKGTSFQQLKLIKDEINHFLLQSANSKFLHWKKNSECKDTGLYSCIANFTKDEIIRSVQIYVLCPFHLTHPEKNNTVYYGRKQNKIIITIEVYGYPKPTQYMLVKNKTHVFIRNGNSETHNNSLYSIEFVRNISAHGVVLLTFKELQNSDFTEMNLHIGNGNGRSLVYNFSIKGESYFESFLNIVIGLGVSLVTLILICGIWIFKNKISQNLLHRKKGMETKSIEGVVAEEEDNIYLDVIEDNIYLDVIDPYELTNEIEEIE